MYISQESGVIGLNFHQSKEVLISDSNGSSYGVSLKHSQSQRLSLIVLIYYSLMEALLLFQLLGKANRLLIVMTAE